MSQETRLLWLYDELVDKACSENPLKPTHATVLMVLLARDFRGEPPITKVELGAIVGIKERQVHSILLDLEGKIDDYLKKRRQGGAGKGRAANVYDIRPDATGKSIPPEWRGNQHPTTGKQLQVASNMQSSAGNAVPSASPDRQSVAREAPSATSTQLLVACGEVLPPMDKHAPARGLDNHLTTEDSSSSERAELAATAARAPVRLNGSAAGMHAYELMSKLIEIVDCPSLDARSHGLAKTCHEIKNWMADGADFDDDIVPTVRVLCERKNGQPIKSLTYFTDAVRDAARARMALERQARNPITPKEANANEHAPRHSYASAGKRRARSVETEILMRDILDDSPRPVGRVDLSAGK